MANSEIIGAGQDTARPAQKTTPEILDVCSGSRAFWFDKKDSRVLFGDKRVGVYPRRHNDTPRSPVVVSPSYQGSFTNLPFRNETFWHVIFDPPHFVNSGGGSNLSQYYGELTLNWKYDLMRGFAECFRVLRIHGTLIFKWNEFNIPLSEILELTPEKPLYGHRTGRLAKTHWVAFVKEDRPSWAKSPAQKTMENCHTAPNSASMQALQMAMEL